MALMFRTAPWSCFGIAGVRSLLLCGNISRCEGGEIGVSSQLSLCSRVLWGVDSPIRRARLFAVLATSRHTEMTGKQWRGDDVSGTMSPSHPPNPRWARMSYCL